MDEERIEAVIGAAYEAALDRDAWGGLLGRLAALFRCHFADVFARTTMFTEFAGVAHGLDRADYENEFLGTWVTRNVWGSAHPPRFSGEVVTTREMVDKPALLRSEMYNAYLAPRDLHEGLRLTLSVGGGWVQDMSLLRSWDAGPFDATERAVAGRLLPHLRRAVAVAERLREAEGARAAGLAALEAVRHAAIVLDRAGRDVCTNAAGRALLDTPAGPLRRGPGGLTSPDPATARALATLLARAASPEAPTSGHLRLPRTDHRPTLLLLAMPVAAATSDPFGLREPATVLLISQPDTDDAGLAAQLSTVFGLTAAEAALAADLLAGHSLATIAATSGRSVNTVRTHLARLMSKTGTQRQGTLMRELTAAAQLRLLPVPAMVAGARVLARGSAP